MMKEETHVFQGMRRDNHQIRQDGKFLWDAHNIRLTNRDNDTLLSITNERGTRNEGITFNGLYVGHCVLGKYLVVFTADKDGSNNYIYRLEKTDSGYINIILFHEPTKWEHCWSPENPIEAIGVYETELVQKIYWVDGVNQPRVINIAKPELKLPKYIDNGNQLLLIDGVNLSGPSPHFSTNPSIDQYLDTHYPDGFYTRDSFDFIRQLPLQEKVDIIKKYGQGEFSSGTIQYAFSYYNKYEQETNICYITPLYYISPKDRGGSPEEKISCSFVINIWGADTKFEYIRIYSIHRTSIDATPIVKQVADVPTLREDLGDAVTFCDTGEIGDTIDPERLLYIGGRSVVPECIESKDGTLFLGNYTIQSDKDLDDIKETISDWELDDYHIPVSPVSVKTEGSYYSYEPNLSFTSGAGFKTGESYRFGLQVQYDTGEWSNPIFLGDSVLCEEYPWVTWSETSPYRNSKSIRIGGRGINRELRRYGVKKIRSCVVFPSPSNTKVICQGILCPTLRRANSDYSYVSSWFFRPATMEDTSNSTVGSYIPFKHNVPLKTLTDTTQSGSIRSVEIQNMIPPGERDGKNGYVVDENVVTFHSPDLEFNPSLSNLDFSGTKLLIVGIAKLGAIYGDVDIETSSPGINRRGASSAITKPVGYPIGSKSKSNGGLVSELLYQDNAVGVRDDKYLGSKDFYYWLVCPWHRTGSLNNDEEREQDNVGNKATRTAKLLKKKLSNLKFFNENTWLSDTSPMQYNISTPQLFSANELSLLKLPLSYLGKDATYLGNVDTLITTGESYKLYGSSKSDAGKEEIISISGEVDDESNEKIKLINSSSDPVRIKYKSSPHLVFSLVNQGSIVELLPRHASFTKGELSYEDWMINKSSPESQISYDASLYLYTSEVLSKSGYDGTVGIPADAQLLGQYAIGISENTVSHSRGYCLYQCKQGRRGISWVVVGIPPEGLILKASGTRISPSNHYLLETDKYDYSRPFHTGMYHLILTKYYKVTSEDNTLKLTDVTDELRENQPSGETVVPTPQRLTFGKEGSSLDSPYLLIGEIVRDKVNNKFNTDGVTDTHSLWFPAGEPVLVSNIEGVDEIVVPIQYGDTWYSRYDCLKTYPFTQEDENQVVEIGSFMCETRVNIDGRYDRNRGQLSNLNMTPQNFNLINEVYSQKDNFFKYRILDEDYYKQDTFANQITWSKEKHAGEEVDTWTNITLANTLDMSGDKGSVNALKVWNEYLLCFQDKALSQILFNSRAQIPVSDGIPIEISNGYKVDSSRLLNGNIGCSNKWSIVDTPAGVYFLDSNTDSIYLFNGQTANLSKDRGMDWWARSIADDKIWKPISSLDNGIRTFYDSKYGDVYFTPGPVTDIQGDALCYSEHIGQFTSFMSYGGTQAMFNYADGFYSIRDDDNRNITKLYLNNAGKYNDFYGNPEGWSFSFISNQDPTFTKVFDTIELRTDHYNMLKLSRAPLDSCPMNYIKVSNEYQDSGNVPLDNINMRKKFRVWRGLLPRHAGTRERIRNPWAMITLGWIPPSDPATSKPGTNDMRAVVHDVAVKYTV